VHNIDGVKPPTSRFIWKSKGTSSYCILRDPAERAKLLSLLREVDIKEALMIC
jgi:hypothetical protein